MSEKRKMIPFPENIHNMARDHLKEVRKKTGAKITISSFASRAVMEKIQKDKFKTII